MHILHLDSSINGELSVSRKLTKTVVSALQRDRNDTFTTYRDLIEEAIPHLDGPIGAGFRPLPFAEFNAAIRTEHARSDDLVAELVSADIIVIGAPMYNFSVATQLKAWLDRVIQPGKTFRYTSTGPEGLMLNKTAIIVSTRGGSYLSGPLAPLDFQEGYLKAALGFMGIKDVHVVRAENMSRGEEACKIATDQAFAYIGTLTSQLGAALNETTHIAGGK